MLKLLKSANADSAMPIIASCFMIASLKPAASDGLHLRVQSWQPEPAVSIGVFMTAGGYWSSCSAPKDKTKQKSLTRTFFRSAAATLFRANATA
jgi:hypothetical protein